MSRPADEATAGSHSDRSSRRHGFSEAVSLVLAGAAGIAMLVVGTVVGRLVFDNAHGPLGYYGPLGHLPTVIGTSAAYSAGAASGLATFGGIWWVARRSRRALVTCLVAGTALVWVLFPQRIDVHESFWPIPNERFSCSGLTFRHYPPATSDASGTVYCVGFEQRISDG